MQINMVIAYHKAGFSGRLFFKSCSALVRIVALTLFIYVNCAKKRLISFLAFRITTTSVRHILARYNIVDGRRITGVIPLFCDMVRDFTSENPREFAHPQSRLDCVLEDLGMQASHTAAAIGADPYLCKAVHRAFHSALYTRGCNPGVIDGEQVEPTKGALRRFQMGRGLTVSGKMSTETLDALCITYQDRQGRSLQLNLHTTVKLTIGVPGPT
ncbi:peptidoglycan-binding domain-containing protein [Dyella japonica]|uniref:peptidoglycan-binding domain-containing protein n=1 Tax=Dyella japonica TaxID=231455 RepID=UPI001F2C6597|nr:peptidoglycan-binding domain-containing protein [Dyella japonica]